MNFFLSLSLSFSSCIWRSQTLNILKVEKCTPEWLVVQRHSWKNSSREHLQRDLGRQDCEEVWQAYRLGYTNIYSTHLVITSASIYRDTDLILLQTSLTLCYCSSCQMLLLPLYSFLFATWEPSPFVCGKQCLVPNTASRRKTRLNKWILVNCFTKKTWVKLPVMNTFIG